MIFAESTEGRSSRAKQEPRPLLYAAAPAVYALTYPGFVNLFHHLVGDAGHTVPTPNAILAGVTLLLMLSVPAFGLHRALRGLQDPITPTAFEARARRLAYMVVIAPTMYCMVGVLQILLHSPLPDELTWALVWCLGIVWLAMTPTVGNRAIPLTTPIPSLRVAHAISGLIVLLYVSFHLFNHLFALEGQDAHAAVMAVGRKVYRSALVEPILVAALLFQITSGCILAWKWSAKPLDFYRTFQVASGFYLSIYILGHMNSVFILARSYFGIETGWDFATGAPNGLIHDAWSIRLIPHYALGVFLVVAHPFSGLRVVMFAHQARGTLTNAIFWMGMLLAAMISVTIMLAMCGLRL